MDPREKQNMMAAQSPSPQQWPLYKKLRVSVTAFAVTFTLLFTTTGYTTGLMDVVSRFDVSMETAIVPYSIFLFGIAFAPLYTPHLNELFGRLPVYLVALPMMSLFTLGAGLARNIGTLIVCRFFAGLFGGPIVVLIEGTYADVWAAETTVTYYSFLALAQYLGAASGPVILDHIVPVEDYRWTQYVALMFSLLSLLLLIGFHETFPRELIRREARRAGKPHNLPPAQSGTTFAQAANLTVVQPIFLIFGNVVVMLIALAMILNFGILFALFIAVPGGLQMTYNFTPQRIGDAFISAIGGSVAAAVTCVLFDQLHYRLRVKNNRMKDMMNIEHRLLPAMLGGIFMTASLFWIAWTLKPTTTFNAPIVASAFYVWGSMMMLVSFISYLFDAFTPPGTLAALTIVAVARVVAAGVFPLFIVQMINKLKPKWAFSLFGFIQIAMMMVPFFLFFFGKRIRMTSKFSPEVNESNQQKFTDVSNEMSNGSTDYNGGMYSNTSIGDNAA